MKIEPLINKLDEKKTLKEVEDHLKSFVKIRHFFSVVEIDEVHVPYPIYGRKSQFYMENKMLQKVLKTEHINAITKTYIDHMMCAINLLDIYDRTLILSKYLFEMDEEEICAHLQVSSRKAWSDMRNAKMNLAFLLGCEIYKQ